MRAVQIADVGNAIATSQVALPKDVCDTVYERRWGASQLATVTGDVNSGFHVALSVGVDTTTEPSSGGAPPGGAGSGGPPPSGAPGGSGRPSGPPPSR